ncbi:hypothetical protein ACFLQ2_05135, partial [archaeon]
MQKGLSAVLGVVLIIGTAVVGAGAMYFFAGGIATTQADPDTPTPLTIVPLGNGEILVANLGSTEFIDTLYSTDPAITVSCPTIAAGEQASCTVDGTTSESTFLIYGAGASGVVIETEAVFNTGGCDWEGTCTYTWDNGAGNGLWEDGRNWGNENVGAYPNSSDDIALFDGTSNDDCDTSGSITVGHIDTSDYTGTITLGGDLTLSDDGGQNGYFYLHGGELDANGHSIWTDGMMQVSTAILTCGSGDHQFGTDATPAYGLQIGSSAGGVFNGGTGYHNISGSGVYIGNRPVTLTTGLTEISKGNIGYYNPTFNHSYGTIKLSHPSATQTIYSHYATDPVFYDLVLDKAAGDVYLADSAYVTAWALTIANDFTINSGT